MLNKSIARLEEIIDAETDALRSGRTFDQEEFNRRKSQSLLELTRLARTIGPDAVAPDLRVRLETLKSKLDANHAMLGMHLRAVQEVSEIVTSAIRSAESDGTYSARIR